MIIHWHMTRYWCLVWIDLVHKYNPSHRHSYGFLVFIIMAKYCWGEAPPTGCPACQPASLGPKLMPRSRAPLCRRFHYAPSFQVPVAETRSKVAAGEENPSPAEEQRNPREAWQRWEAELTVRLAAAPLGFGVVGQGYGELPLCPRAMY
jgi:hypothetical protein